MFNLLLARCLRLSRTCRLFASRLLDRLIRQQEYRLGSRVIYLLDRNGAEAVRFVKNAIVKARTTPEPVPGDHSTVVLRGPHQAFFTRAKNSYNRNPAGRCHMHRPRIVAQEQVTARENCQEFS